MSGTPSEHYAKTVEQMVRGALLWLEQHPRAELVVRVPADGVHLIGPLDGFGCRLLGGNADTQSFFRFVDEFALHEATLMQALALLEFLPPERVTIRELAAELERLRNQRLN